MFFSLPLYFRWCFVFIFFVCLRRHCSEWFSPLNLCNVNGFSFHFAKLSLVEIYTHTYTHTLTLNSFIFSHRRRRRHRVPLHRLLPRLHCQPPSINQHPWASVWYWSRLRVPRGLFKWIQKYAGDKNAYIHRHKPGQRSRLYQRQEENCAGKNFADCFRFGIFWKCGMYNGIECVGVESFFCGATELWLTGENSKFPFFCSENDCLKCWREK